MRNLEVCLTRHDNNGMNYRRRNDSRCQQVPTSTYMAVAQRLSEIMIKVSGPSFLLFQYGPHFPFGSPFFIPTDNEVERLSSSRTIAAPHGCMRSKSDRKMKEGPTKPSMQTPYLKGSTTAVFRSCYWLFDTKPTTHLGSADN